MTKGIQINTSEEVYKKTSKIAEKLRTSRGGLGELALEFALPKIESGELVFMNGKLLPANQLGAKR